MRELIRIFSQRCSATCFFRTDYRKLLLCNAIKYSINSLSRSLTSPSVGTCRDKASTIKKERVISLFLFSTSRTIEQPSSSRVTSSSMKKITLILRQGNDEKRDGISFLSCIWMRTTNKKVAQNVPLSCFHWHISCHFWSFDDITENPGSAWAITESDSSFPLCSLNTCLYGIPPTTNRIN